MTLPSIPEGLFANNTLQVGHNHRKDIRRAVLMCKQPRLRGWQLQAKMVTNCTFVKNACGTAPARHHGHMFLGTGEDEQSHEDTIHLCDFFCNWADHVPPHHQSLICVATRNTESMKSLASEKKKNAVPPHELQIARQPNSAPVNGFHDLSGRSICRYPASFLWMHRFCGAGHSLQIARLDQATARLDLEDVLLLVWRSFWKAANPQRPRPEPSLPPTPDSEQPPKTESVHQFEACEEKAHDPPKHSAELPKHRRLSASGFAMTPR